MTSPEKWMVLLPAPGGGPATVLGGPFDTRREAEDCKATQPTATGLRAQVIQSEPDGPVS